MVFNNRTWMFLFLCFQGVIVPVQNDQRFLAQNNIPEREQSGPSCGDVCCECGSWALIACACWVVSTLDYSSLLFPNTCHNDFSGHESLQKRHPVPPIMSKKLNENQENPAIVTKKKSNFLTKR